MTIDTQKLRHFAQWIERRYPEGTAKGIVEAADHIDAQAAEIARLREALEAIVSHHDDYFKDSATESNMPWIGQARAALAQEQGEKHDNQD